MTVCTISFESSKTRLRKNPFVNGWMRTWWSDSKYSYCNKLSMPFTSEPSDFCWLLLLLLLLLLIACFWGSFWEGFPTPFSEFVLLVDFWSNFDETFEMKGKIGALEELFSCSKTWGLIVIRLHKIADMTEMIWFGVTKLLPSKTAITLPQQRKKKKGLYFDPKKKKQKRNCVLDNAFNHKGGSDWRTKQNKWMNS